MPRKKQTIHASRLVEHKATVGKTIDGKRIQKSFYGNSKLEARRKSEDYIREQELAFATGDVFIKKEYTFGEWATKWLETYKKPNVSENTYRFTYENTVINHLTPYFGKAELTNILPIDVQKFFATKSTLSETMLNKMLMCLNSIFETAIENDLCYKNPAKRIIYTTTATKNDKQVYSTNEIEQVKYLFKDTMPEVFISLETGLRRGEILGLQWGDIDFTENTISINRSIATTKTNRINIVPPKWNSYRTIPVGNETIVLLKSLSRNGEYVFPLANGEPQAPNSWSQKLKAHMNKLPESLPRLTSHELRHTYGTNLRRRGVDIYTIQKIMGHRDIKMTSELYVHNELAELKKAMKL